MTKIYSFEKCQKNVNPGVRTITYLVGKRTGNEKVAANFQVFEPGAEPGGIHYHEKRGRAPTSPSRRAPHFSSTVGSTR